MTIMHSHQQCIKTLVLFFLKHYFWGIHGKTLPNERTKAPWKFKGNVSSSLNLSSASSHTVHGQAPWDFPIPKEKLFGEPGSVTTHDLNYAQVFKNTEGSSIIKSIKQSSQPKEAVEEKKNRVWAALWEINSTAFHQVEILALDTHKNEPGLIWAPSGHLPDHKSWPNWPASPQRRPLLEEQRYCWEEPTRTDRTADRKMAEHSRTARARVGVCFQESHFVNAFLNSNITAAFDLISGFYWLQSLSLYVL